LTTPRTTVFVFLTVSESVLSLSDDSSFDGIGIDAPGIRWCFISSQLLAIPYIPPPIARPAPIKPPYLRYFFHAGST